MAKEYPITIAQYAKENTLLDAPGWKGFKIHTRNQKVFIRMLRQANATRHRHAPKLKFGLRVSRSYKEGKIHDQQNGNHAWQEAIDKDLLQFGDYETFKVWKGHCIPQGYQKIKCHLVFDAKHDGRKKARLVVTGNLTPEPDDTPCADIAHLMTVRIAIFLSMLNGLLLCDTDMRNAHVETLTRENVYIIIVPEVCDRTGKILLVSKAVHGQRTSGARFDKKMTDVLKDLGYVSYKADLATWMKDLGIY